MQIDPNNHVVKLCAQGMEMEGQGQPEKASALFLQAWNESTTTFEKFTSAHYVARHQPRVADKLQWDEIALQFAMQINDGTVDGLLPSLYLNVAKCYEDLNDFALAKLHYEKALAACSSLATDSYGNMIRAGVLKGIDRVR